MKPSTLLSFLIELDAIRQPARFKDFLKACEADSRGRAGLELCPTPAADLMSKALEAALSVDAGLVASAFTEPEKIKAAMHSNKEKWVALKTPIPVLITYFTSWVDNKGMLNFRDDIYGHDAKMKERLFQ